MFDICSPIGSIAHTSHDRNDKIPILEIFFQLMKIINCNCPLNMEQAHWDRNLPSLNRYAIYVTWATQNIKISRRVAVNFPDS
jgi:hypothetical protein